MIIYVDADACPVTHIINDLAKKYNISVILVRSFSHYTNKKEDVHVQTIYVDNGNDSVDYKIVQLVEKHDIVVTQDYGLASLCLAKQCFVLHHKGFAYTDKNIDTLLQSRYTNLMARKSGKRTKGPKPLTSTDEENFRQLLEHTIKSAWHQNNSENL